MKAAAPPHFCPSWPTLRLWAGKLKRHNLIPAERRSGWASHPELSPCSALSHLLSWAAGLVGLGQGEPWRSNNKHISQLAEIWSLWRVYLAKSIPSTAEQPMQFSELRSPALCLPSWGPAESNIKMIQGRDNTAPDPGKPPQLLTMQCIFEFLSSVGSCSKAGALCLAQLQMETSYYLPFPRIHSVESNFESLGE